MPGLREIGSWPGAAVAAVMLLVEVALRVAWVREIGSRPGAAAIAERRRVAR